MTQIHGANVRVHIDDNSAASQDISGDQNQATLTYSRDNPEVTTFSKVAVQRLSGLRDVQFALTGIFNTGTNNTTCIIGGLMSGSNVTLVRWYPAGSTTGCIFWAACMLVSQYAESAPVNGAVAANVTFQLASGSLSASTV